MHYEDILEAVQLVSATEVMNCLKFCLRPWKGTQWKKILLGLSTLLHFPRWYWLFASTHLKIFTTHIHFTNPLDDLRATLQYNLPIIMIVWPGSRRSGHVHTLGWGRAEEKQNRVLGPTKPQQPSYSPDALPAHGLQNWCLFTSSLRKIRPD